MRHQSGFTLIELMIVVAVIGILAAIAYPNYQQYQLKAGRSDGHAKLTQLMQMQERLYSQNQTYSTDLGAGANTAVLSDEQRYSITAEACAAGTPLARCVRLVATAINQQVADTQCGNLILTSRGEKLISGTGTRESCW
ncbi:type 4 fimbrial biogenesis protein PilE [Stutzerimonas stutzeri ATCC 14405 = CCUG 16156]|uniref:type IV pilin protein n=1 Tax=Stutzerimonas stutzeri TaxID=316 RepID=UPI0002548E5E|nr:type IV pilin protein [Stutzerimonas stutzeri]EHY76885.1 type 4 fimbrial biogenesis protein PilE [Stutzerimonas stutzeri ATCC 14405 = CCUG 16156]NRF48498.1 type IV pilin protein [Stutzerimonas stutzeri]QOZ96959.1 type IV pilin protein [Stutzerimonas stutzeri]